MDVVDALAMQGGVASRGRLIALSSRRDFDRALKARRIVRGSRQLYRLPDLDLAARKAVDLGGRVAVLSAAIAHGWEVPRPPDRPWIMFDNRSHPLSTAGVEAVWGNLADESGLVTSRRRTIVDCARRLPFDLALCVADSALRHGVDHETFVRDAAAVRGKGAAQARRVAALASPLPANPFESALRALTIRAGLDMEPQAAIVIPGIGEPDREVHPDLVERALGLVVEAESWEFHAGNEAFQRDCWRYTSLVVNGWMVLRFTWWQVTYQPEWVVACLIAAKRALTAENAA